jgi:four helix bundle protein
MAGCGVLWTWWTEWTHVDGMDLGRRRPAQLADIFCGRLRRRAAMAFARKPQGEKPPERKALEKEPLIPKHGGYRNLKSFQVAQLVYDVTVRFCDRYISKRSRTHDQMLQAARSGVQNIAEGSQAAGTSKKTELKLTNVARASLEELRLDYEDFLRQRSLPLWDRKDPRRADLIARRCATADAVALWAREKRNGQHGQSGQELSGQKQNRLEQSISGEPSTKSMQSTASTFPEIAANAALVLIAVACSLLDRQLAAQAALFSRRAASRSGFSACGVMSAEATAWTEWPWWPLWTAARARVDQGNGFGISAHEILEVFADVFFSHRLCGQVPVGFKAGIHQIGQSCIGWTLPQL